MHVEVREALMDEVRRVAEDGKKTVTAVVEEALEERVKKEGGAGVAQAARP